MAEIAASTWDALLPFLRSRLRCPGGATEISVSGMHPRKWWAAELIVSAAAQTGTTTPLATSPSHTRALLLDARRLRPGRFTPGVRGLHGGKSIRAADNDVARYAVYCKIELL